MQVRNTIKYWREQRELSLRQLAERSDVHHVQLHRLENGTGSVSDAGKVRIADALGVSVAALFFPDFTSTVENQSTPAQPLAGTVA